MTRAARAQGRGHRGALSVQWAIEVAVTVSASLVMMLMVALGGVASESLALAETSRAHVAGGVEPYDDVASEPFSREGTTGAEPPPLPQHEST